MSSKPKTISSFLEALPKERKTVVLKLRQEILNHLPEGMEEVINYGMLGYVVPHSVYPNGYHCDPKQPLPFMNLASQKNHIAIYSMPLYAKADLLEWFITEYNQVCKYKLDLGKSCIRFKRMDDIPFALIGALTKKISTQDWIAIYENTIK